MGSLFHNRTLCCAACELCALPSGMAELCAASGHLQIMFTAVDYQLKADNCVSAAQMAETRGERETFIRAAAIYRNKALRMKLGKRADVLRYCPFTRDQLRAL